MEKFIDIKLNGRNLQVNQQFTVLQACEVGGVDIPRFCFHEHLSIAGNCRMCLVEVQKSLKPVASCALPVAPGMVVFTESSLVRRAREGVLEFLLVNHPLDCPICDQGGECDLQDQTIVFGSDRGRFYDYKRAVFDKDLGPLIKTVMTRCIHCTRCVRFAREIGGSFDLGVVGRGMFMEIGTYIESVLESELSGNIIDLCPVGALTSKPSAFKARSWELNKVEGLDLFDCFGANIVLNLRGLEIIRVLPRVGHGLGWDWITDKIRFFYDGIKKQRLGMPVVRLSDFTCKFTWEDVIVRLWWFLRNQSSFKGVIGGQASLEMVLLFKEVLRLWGGSTLLPENRNLVGDTRSSYLSSFSMDKIDLVEKIVTIGSNLRYDLPLVHSRFRYNASIGLMDYISFGGAFNKRGNSLKECFDFLGGTNSESLQFQGIGDNKIFVSKSFVKDLDDVQISLLKEYIKSYLKAEISFVETEVGKLSALELGIQTKTVEVVNKEEELPLVYVIGGEKSIKRARNNSKGIMIYQGGFLTDSLLESFNILLPGVVFTERRGTYLNLFGFLQLSNFVAEGPAKSLSDEVILFLFLKAFRYNMNWVAHKLTKYLSSFISLRSLYALNFVFNICNIKRNLHNKIVLLGSRLLGRGFLYSLKKARSFAGQFLVNKNQRLNTAYVGVEICSPETANYFQTSELVKASTICQSVSWSPSLFKK